MAWKITFRSWIKRIYYTQNHISYIFETKFRKFLFLFDVEYKITGNS